MRTIITTGLFIISFFATAGQKAITDSGDVVILNDDGTWVFVDRNKKIEKKISLNNQRFQKPDNASYLLKSNNNSSAFWVNVERWEIDRVNKKADAEFHFNFKQSELNALAITESTFIPIETLAEIALENTQNAAPDASIAKQEFRMVNGKKILYMEIIGTVGKTHYTYIGYYFSDASGTTQLLTFIDTDKKQEFSRDINDFLNGFTTL